MNRSAQNLHRCFYALPLPSEPNRIVSDLIGELRRHDDGGIRWTPPQNLHLTLRFLGELEEAPFHAAAEFLHSTPFGEGFRLRIGNVDAFPSLRKPSVLVLAVAGEKSEDHQRLLELQKKIEEFARSLGLPPEQRPFRPHITLGRVRRERSLSPALRTALQNVWKEAPEKRSGEMAGEIDALLFLESLLKPEGAIYKERGRAYLA